MADTPQPDAGLSRAEVDRIVQDAVAGIPSHNPASLLHRSMRPSDPPVAGMREPAPGLTSDQVEGIIKAAVADIPEPMPGLTSAEGERIARGVMASLPPRSDLAEYTRFFVEKAISRYETQGLDATLAHYNRPESIDGQ